MFAFQDLDGYVRVLLFLAKERARGKVILLGIVSFSAAE